MKIHKNHKQRRLKRNKMEKRFRYTMGGIGFTLVLIPPLFKIPLILGLPMIITALIIACVVGENETDNLISFKSRKENKDGI